VLLLRHRAETGSAVAGGLLAGWPTAVDRFAKVMPRDYKRVLAAASPSIKEVLS
jgi:glutamate synthase (NADPH/NADH) large chain